MICSSLTSISTVIFFQLYSSILKNLLCTKHGVSIKRCVARFDSFWLCAWATVWTPFLSSTYARRKESIHQASLRVKVIIKKKKQHRKLNNESTKQKVKRVGCRARLGVWGNERPRPAGGGALQQRRAATLCPFKLPIPSQHWKINSRGGVQ